MTEQKLYVKRTEFLSSGELLTMILYISPSQQRHITEVFSCGWIKFYNNFVISSVIPNLRLTVDFAVLFEWVKAEFCQTDHL